MGQRGGEGCFNPFIPTQCVSANPLMCLPPASCVVVDIFKSPRALPRWGVGREVERGDGRGGGWGGGVVPSLESLGRGRPRAEFFLHGQRRRKKFLLQYELERALRRERE